MTINRNLKKILVILLVLSLSFYGLTACTEGENNDLNKNEANQEGDPVNDNETDDNTPSNDGEFTTRDLNEQLVMAAAWYQTAAEMRALSYQAFNLAKMVYDNDLKSNTSKEKRAVIVDIDETVLDNSPYEAGLVGNEYGYSTGWGEWLETASAKALPGSIEFLNYVVDNSGDVFYVSNRKEEYKESTMKNLTDLGFPQVTEENVLLREETSDKEPRRQIVDENHRIVLLMGDNLNDFDSNFAEKGIEERFQVTDTNSDKFGSYFIVLPNPMYGEWEGAIYDYDWSISDEEKSQKRKSKLNTFVVE